ncbi:MAG: UDP-N-acetylmuramoyl-tripeptide--D-alanyl-D-alanine ligase [Planctomycetes bacterium]|nr:UDP-N-acetylmuramoyl-tripeptide--D-alanyl-D-alanine ligase [Planctomycetota bacterium]
MIPMSLAQIQWVTQAELSGAIEHGMVLGVATDSRSVKPGDLFVAIKGERFDGHHYVEQALVGGAKACLVSKAFRVESDWPLLHVDDVVDALGLLAAHHRRICEARVIAITGSAGKTTTKAMIAHVLSQSHPTAAAPKSFNNRIGVPLTLLSANRGDQFVVVEIGTSRPGEVKSLSAMATPDVGVVTSVGAAHLAGFGTIDAIWKEKFSLFDHVQTGGRAFVNADVVDGVGVLPRAGELGWQTFGDHPEADLRITEIDSDLARTTALIDGVYRVELPVAGKHNAVNACAAFGVCASLGISPQEIASALATFNMPPMRLAIRSAGPWTLIDDCYNANPLSMAASLDVLRSVKNGRRVFVAGTMAELGDVASECHVQLGECAEAAGVDLFVAVGNFASDMKLGATRNRTGPIVREFASTQDTLDQLPGLLQDGDTVLVKGSRSAGLEKIVHHLIACNEHAGSGIS